MLQEVIILGCILECIRPYEKPVAMQAKFSCFHQ